MRNETHFPEADLEIRELFDIPESRSDDALVSPERDIEETESVPQPESRGRYEGEKIDDENDTDEPRVESIIFDEIHSTRGGNTEDWREGEYHQTYEFRDGKLWYLSGECFTDQVTESGNAEWIEEHGLLLDHLLEQPDKAFSTTTTDFTDENGESHSYGIVSDGTFVQSRHFIYTEAKEELSLEQDTDAEDVGPFIDEPAILFRNNTDRLEQDIPTADNPTVIFEGIENATTEDEAEASMSGAVTDSAEAQTGTGEEEDILAVINEPSYEKQFVSEDQAVLEQIESNENTDDAVVLAAPSLTESIRDTNTIIEPIAREEIIEAELAVEKPQDYSVPHEPVAENPLASDENKITTDVSDKKGVTSAIEPIITLHVEKVETPLTVPTAREEVKEVTEEASILNIESSSETIVASLALEVKTKEKQEESPVVTQGKSIDTVERPLVAPTEDTKEHERLDELTISEHVDKSETVELADELEVLEERVDAQEVESLPVEKLIDEQTDAPKNYNKDRAVLSGEKDEVPSETNGEQEMLNSALNELFAGDIFDDSREQRVERKPIEEQGKEGVSSKASERGPVLENTRTLETLSMGGVRLNTRTSRVSRFAANDIGSGNNPQAQIVTRNGIRMERAIAA